MKFNCKESAKKVFDKIGSALRATKAFIVKIAKSTGNALSAAFLKVVAAFKTSIKFIVRYNRQALAGVLSLITVLTLSYFGFSVERFNIFDGKTYRTVSMVGGTMEKALLRLDIAGGYEIVSTKKNGKTTDIVIEYTFPVTINMGKETLTVETATATVGKILEFAGIELDKDDTVKPSVNTVISGETTVYFYDVEYVTGTYNEPIPYDTTVVYSRDLVKGDNQLISGKNGEQTVYYTQKRINGEVVETLINNTQVITTAISGQKIIGTAEPKASAVVTSDRVRAISTLTPTVPIELDANGVPVNYKSKRVVQATAYTYTGHRCSTGVNPQPGYIAVNPSIIPYGTKMYIKSVDGSYIYGYAVAADTGGFIRSRPTNVDLFFSTESACNAFGRRNVEIYILE